MIRTDRRPCNNCLQSSYRQLHYQWGLDPHNWPLLVWPPQRLNHYIKGVMCFDRSRQRNNESTRKDFHTQDACKNKNSMVEGLNLQSRSVITTPTNSPNRNQYKIIWIWKSWTRQQLHTKYFLVFFTSLQLLRAYLRHCFDEQWSFQPCTRR